MSCRCVDSPTARRRRAAAGMFTTALILTGSGSIAIAGTFSEVHNFGSNPGNLKMFTYLPDELPDPAPLVVVLHGCSSEPEPRSQSAKSYLDHSGWKEHADEGGFALLLPEQQIGPGPIFLPSGLNHLARCFNFAELRDSRRDSGEAMSVKQMIDRMRLEHQIDPARIFVNGLSAGGGMTSVMLATYPDVFAAGAIIAGLPYRCGTATRTADVDCGVTLSGQSHKPAPDHPPQEWARRVREAVPGFQGSYPRVSIWQGTADATVDPPNAVELIEQWTAVHGIDQTPDAQEDHGNVTHLQFTDLEGRLLVESYEIRGFGHATPIDPDGEERACGRSGDTYIVDGDVCSTHQIARFFGLIGAAPSVAITEVETDGTTIRLRGTASDPDGEVTEVAARLDGPRPQSSRVAAGIADWSTSFESLPNDTLYMPVVTAVDDDGLSTTVAGPAVAVGSPNRPPSIEIGQVAVERDCVVVDGRAIDPDGRVMDVAVRLGTRGHRPAVLSQERYTFRECGLADGTYATEVRATDDLNAHTTVSGPRVEVRTQVSANATWLGHMQARRLRLYQAPCASIGFGACDAAFPTILANHGSSAFDLFRRATSDDWFLNPGNLQ
jgi:poly(hydroxyalkanoate) depolymerase family esterase